MYVTKIAKYPTEMHNDISFIAGLPVRKKALFSCKATYTALFVAIKTHVNPSGRF